MPNRKTFDQRDKYDHSSHSLTRPEKNDLEPDVRDSAKDQAVPRTPKKGRGESRDRRR